MFDLKGKVALVTGGAQGIGLAYAKELLRNEAKGVALVDVNPVKGSRAVDEIAKEYGKNRAIFVTADVTDKNQLEEAFETTVLFFKQLDILINNAGIVQELQFEKCVAVNLVGLIASSMLATEKYFPKYKSGPEAVVLNISSIKGLNPYEETPVYDATKFAVVGFSRAMGAELHYQTTKVRFVTICPGVTDTTLTDITPEQVADPYFSGYSSYIKNALSQKPEDVAKIAMELIRKAQTGSVWIIRDNKCTKAEFTQY